METADQTAFLTYNLKSGSNQEVVQGESISGTYRLENLNRLTFYQDQTQVTTPGDWENVLVTRGFSGAINDFLVRVKKWQKAASPQVLQQEKVLISHEIVEEILRFVYRQTI